MTITYTWKVTSLKVRNISENKQNAVVQTYWQKIGRDENNNEGIFSGATPFTVDPTDNSGPFIPFEQLTEENVLDWIKTIVVGSYEQHVHEQIKKQIDEKILPITEPRMPWASEQSTPVPPPATAPV
jgi:hypothetical protein